jgi:hypothetical protein
MSKQEYLTSRNIDLLEKLTVAQLVEYVLAFAESEGSLPYGQKKTPLWTVISLMFLLAFKVHCSTLKMETIYSFENSTNFYQSTWRHVPDDNNLRVYLKFNYSFIHQWL